MTLKDNIVLYGITMQARYTNRQKKIFIEYITKYCNSKDIAITIQKVGNASYNASNIIIGNINKAAAVVASGYDTPKKSMLNNTKYYPLSFNKNKKEDQNDFFIQLGLGAILILVGIIIATVFNNNYIVMGCAFGLILLALHLIKGKGNNNNFNRNSVSLAMVMNMVEELNNHNIAFVLLDQHAMSIQGMRGFSKEYKIKVPFVLLESLANGKDIVISHRKNTDVSGLVKEQWINDINTNDNFLTFFKEGIIVSSGDFDGTDVVVAGTKTKQDLHITINQVEEIYDYIRNWLINR